jgi:hypothetical protein
MKVAASVAQKLNLANQTPSIGRVILSPAAAGQRNEVSLSKRILSTKGNLTSHHRLPLPLTIRIPTPSPLRRPLSLRSMRSFAAIPQSPYLLVPAWPRFAGRRRTLCGHPPIPSACETRRPFARGKKPRKTPQKCQPPLNSFRPAIPPRPRPAPYFFFFETVKDFLDINEPPDILCPKQLAR